VNRLQINFDFVMGSDVSDHQPYDRSEMSENSFTDYLASLLGQISDQEGHHIFQQSCLQTCWDFQIIID